jgi:glycosyltransferase involved in cell wall biosynthesis
MRGSEKRERVERPVRALDVSSLARWLGPPTGMLRVERELALHALSMPAKVIPVVYDRDCQGVRPIRPAWAERVLAWSGHLYEDPVLRDSRAGWRRFVPSRHPLLINLELRRLASRSAFSNRFFDATQRLILAVKPAPFALDSPSGQRIDQIPYDVAVGQPLALGPGDALLLASSDWWRKDPQGLCDLKRTGLRLSALCFDIIPLTHPEFFPREDVERFAAHWNTVFAIADTIIVNSNYVKETVVAYCQHQGIRLGASALVPLGATPPEPPPRLIPPRRANIEPGRFALYVSTIEPRKNHDMLLRVWRRLVDCGVPQRLGFKLVLVGRRGWAVDEVIRQIEQPSLFDNTVVHLTDVSDGELWHLFQEAAFCLYPSKTEGFGLPVVEAYARGKAVIVSSGGSLPEAAGGFAPCLDPEDEDAWCGMIRLWMEHPSEVAKAEQQIRKSRPYLSWSEVAERMFAAAGLTTDEVAR